MAPDLEFTDFRSDTVTRPSEQMRRAMSIARVGDDYYREDPTVRELEIYAAELLGKEAALFTTSGTQSNLIAIMAQCDRGEAYVVGHRSHSHLRELGGVAVVASVHAQVIQNLDDGTISLDDIEAALWPSSILFAPVRLIALENTIDGTVLPLDYLSDLADLARRNRLRTHLDGARVFNAATALDIPVSEIAQYFDTVGFCLSKGLGAPVGSVLVGEAEVIKKARRHRQILGGGLRQAGVLAAAGLFALKNNVRRLVDDHRHAKELAKALSRLPGITPQIPKTNMVFCDVSRSIQKEFAGFLADNGIRVSGTHFHQRWVTHLDIDDDALHRTIRSLSDFEASYDAA